MIRHMTELPRRCAVWLRHCSPLARDERGAITTEAAIITAILAVVAAGFAFWLSQDVIPGWAGEVPDPGTGGEGFEPD